MKRQKKNIHKEVKRVLIKKTLMQFVKKVKELKITDDYYNLYFCCKNKDEDINNLLDATPKRAF